MSCLFLDTSSLLKLYHEEKGTSEVVQLVGSFDTIYLSEIATIEFYSAIWKNIRMNWLSKEKGELLTKYFEADKPLFRWCLINKEVLNSAIDLMNKYGMDGLRTLDAIQLSTAVSIKDQVHQFHTSDYLLDRLFKQEGLR